MNLKTTLMDLEKKKLPEGMIAFIAMYCKPEKYHYRRLELTECQS